MKGGPAQKAGLKVGDEMSDSENSIYSGPESLLRINENKGLKWEMTLKHFMI